MMMFKAVFAVLALFMCAAMAAPLVSPTRPSVLFACTFPRLATYLPCWIVQVERNNDDDYMLVTKVITQLVHKVSSPRFNPARSLLIQPGATG